MDGDVDLEQTGPAGSTFLWTVAPAPPTAAGPRLGEPPHVDALQHPDRGEAQQDRRAPVGQERQRDAGDRHDPDHHPHVHEHLDREHRRDARPPRSVPNGSFDRDAMRIARHSSSP